MSARAANALPGFDVESVRRDFPILDQQINGHPLVYLDNAATTQKPECVIEAISNYYRRDNANVHRGVHTLSDRATHAFEQARQTVAGFLASPRVEQVIWTSGTTAAINLVAHSWGRSSLRPGDRVLLVDSAHVPARMLEPGVAQHLALAQVVRVGPHRTELQQLAGPALAPHGTWMALPL